MIREMRYDIVTEIMDEIKSGDITDHENLVERVHEEADNCTIYTSDALDIIREYVLDYGDLDHLDKGLWENAGSTVGTIAGMAYAIMCEEIWSGLYDELKSTYGTTDYDEVFLNFFECFVCGDREYIEHAGGKTDDGPICQSCYDKDYIECPSCGDIVKVALTTEGLCEYCHEGAK